MSERMQLLENAYQEITKYTSYHNVDNEWRPGIIDLMVYDILLGMYESDYEDTEPYMLWTKTPDEVMEHIITSRHGFDLEFGLDQMDEEIRDYLNNEGFTVDADELTDEEYQANLEGRI